MIRRPPRSTLFPYTDALPICSTRCGATTRSRSRTPSRCSCPTSGGSWKPVASPGSFTRSAARATSSAYRRLPIRWRLAGGSALLTLVILLGFAAIVGVLTTRSIRSDFDREVAASADALKKQIRPEWLLDSDGPRIRLSKDTPDLDDYDASLNPVIRVVTVDG